MLLQITSVGTVGRGVGGWRLVVVTVVVILVVGMIRRTVGTEKIIDNTVRKIANNKIARMIMLSTKDYNYNNKIKKNKW